MDISSPLRRISPYSADRSAKNAKPSLHISSKHPSIQHPQFHPPAIQRRERISNTIIMQRVLVASRGVWGALGVTQFRAMYGSIGIRGCSTDVAIERSGRGLFDAILMAKSIGTMESLKDDAKKTLANALKVEELHVNKVNDNLFVGNQRGLDFASLAQRLDTELAARDLKIAELSGKFDLTQTELAARGLKIAELSGKFDLTQTELAKRDLKIAELDSKFELADSRNEERLRYLLCADDSYQAVREGYISVYKRDYLRTETERDHEIIGQRNSTVHWGDAHSDAALYTKPNGRTDPEVFKKLYGLLPEEIDKISKKCPQFSFGSEYEKANVFR